MYKRQDLLIDVGLRPLDGKVEKPLLGFGQVKIPAGTSAGFLNGCLLYTSRCV